MVHNEIHHIYVTSKKLIDAVAEHMFGLQKTISDSCIFVTSSSRLFFAAAKAAFSDADSFSDSVRLFSAFWIQYIICGSGSGMLFVDPDPVISFADSDLVCYFQVRI